MGVVGITALRPTRCFIMLLRPILSTVVVRKGDWLHGFRLTRNIDRRIPTTDTFLVKRVRDNRIPILTSATFLGVI